MRTQRETIVLFDGERLDNWTSEKGGPAQWRVEDGVRRNVSPRMLPASETGDRGNLVLEFCG